MSHRCSPSAAATAAAAAASKLAGKTPRQSKTRRSALAEQRVGPLDGGLQRLLAGRRHRPGRGSAAGTAHPAARRSRPGAAPRPGRRPARSPAGSRPAAGRSRRRPPRSPGSARSRGARPRRAGRTGTPRRWRRRPPRPRPVAAAAAAAARRPAHLPRSALAGSWPAGAPPGSCAECRGEDSRRAPRKCSQLSSTTAARFWYAGTPRCCRPSTSPAAGAPAGRPRRPAPSSPRQRPRAARTATPRRGRTAAGRPRRAAPAGSCRPRPARSPSPAASAPSP